jgi:hypothetical protein
MGHASAAMTALYTGELPLEDVRTEFRLKFGPTTHALDCCERDCNVNPCLRIKALQASVMETEKLAISLLESGAGDGNRTTSEAWEALNKTLKAIELAALSFPSDGLNWKLDGN